LTEHPGADQTRRAADGRDRSHRRATRPTSVRNQLDLIAGMLGRHFLKVETMLREAAHELTAFDFRDLNPSCLEAPPAR
jgi:hypothetical protein